MEVTIADVAAILKCNHEPPESNVPWLKCPSMLTLEDIVFDMCEGQYADSRRNAASKTKIPQNLLFIDMVLYRNLFLRGGTCSSVHSIEVSGAPFPRSYGGKLRNSRNECTIGRLST
jgi:hypothetical protein